MSMLLILLGLLLWISQAQPRNLVIVPPSPVTSASLTKISVIKSQLDPLNYTAFKLPNNLQFMVVIDPSIQTDMLYAWSVHAGELQSPPQYSGMEYVFASAILYGSDNYVALDSYLNFIAPASMFGKRELRLDAITIVQGGPSSLGSQIVSRVTDILVAPQLSNIAVGNGITQATKAISFYGKRFDLTLIFLQLFCSKDYIRVFLPELAQSLIKHTVGDYAAQVRKYYNSYISSDISSASIMLAEWNQTLIDQAINKLAQMADRSALSRLYNQSVIKDLTSSTPLYYLINSPSQPAELYIRIIPTKGADQKYAYQEIWLLIELMDTSDGLVDVLKSKFPQIDNVLKVVRETNQNNYPSIQIRVFFKPGQSLTNIPQKIYAYISGYMTQNWGKVYNSEINKIIDSLNYKFLISPFDLSDPLEKLKNIVFNMGFDTPSNALKSLFSVDKSKIQPDEKVQHQFKVIGLQLGNFTGDGDGIDSVFKLKYKAVKISEPIPTVPPPVFTPNPYAFTPAAQFTGYPNQDWPSSQNGSVIFYPNPHPYQPFSSVSCIIHFKSPNPPFARLFLKMVTQKVQKDVRLVRQVQLIPQWDLNLVTIEQSGTVAPIFRFFGVFFEAVFSSFNEDLFNDAKSTLSAQLKSYNTTTSIEDITFIDQSLLQSPSQPTIQQLVSSIDSYDFNAFLVDIAQFTNSFKLQWLVIGFKDTNPDIQKNIADLMTKKSLSPYSASAAPVYTPYSKTITRGLKTISALYFIDFGKKSVNALVMAYLFKEVINNGIGSIANSSNYNIVNSVHLTLSGRIGLNLFVSSPSSNSPNPQGIFDSLLQGIESKEQTTFLQNNFNTIRQVAQKALTFTSPSKSILATFKVLNDYLSAGCYECLLAWPSQIASTISAITFPQLQTAWKAAIAAKSIVIEQS